MSKHIEFKFDKDLPHQQAAIKSVIKLFNGLDKNGDNIYGNIFRRKNLVENEPIRNPEILTPTKLLENLNKIP